MESLTKRTAPNLDNKNRFFKDSVYHNNLSKDAVQQYLKEADYEKVLAQSLARQVEKNKIESDQQSLQQV